MGSLKYEELMLSLVWLVDLYSTSLDAVHELASTASL